MKVKDVCEENRNGFCLVCRPNYERYPDETTISQWFKANALHAGFDIYLFRANFGPELGFKSGFVVVGGKDYISPIDVFQDKGLRGAAIILDPDEYAERKVVKIVLPKYGTVSYGRAIAGYDSPLEDFYKAHAIE